jgi:hypothetical protein
VCVSVAVVDSGANAPVPTPPTPAAASAAATVTNAPDVAVSKVTAVDTDNADESDWP